MSAKKKYESKREKKCEGLLLLLPLLVFLAVVPLIVYLKVVELDEVIISFWKGGAQNADFFSYYKSLWIIYCGVLSLISLGIGYYLKNYKIKQLNIYYLTFALFALLTLLSALFSEYKSIAFWGFPDRHEGALVMLAYLAVTFTTINLINKQIHVKVTIGFLFSSAFIAASIGIFQYFGYDFFQSFVGLLLILPPQFHPHAQSLSFAFGPGTIYSTMYNTNYVGSYMSMLFSLSFVLFLFIKNNYKKIAMGAFILLMFAALLGCNSRAGYVGTFFSALVILVLLYRPMLRQWRHIVILLFCCFLVFLGMDYGGGGRITGAVRSLFAETMAPELVDLADEDLRAELFYEGMTGERDLGNFSMIIDDNKLTLIPASKESSLNITIRKGQLYFMDENNVALSMKTDEQGKSFAVDDKRFSRFIFTIHNNTLLLKEGDVTLYFSIEPHDSLRFEKMAIPTPPLKGVRAEGSLVTFEGAGASLQMRYKDDTLLFSDQNHEDVILRVLEPGAAFTFNDRRFEDYTITVSDPVVQVQKGRKVFNFTLVDDVFKYINHRGEVVDLEPVPSWGFEGRELMGSSRGYIWSRSIPLLRDTILLGHGPDTYPIYYPQHDYIGKILYLGSTSMIVDKPHNLYLQLGINTGILSLLVFLCLAGYYAASSFILYRHQEYTSYYAVAGTAVFVALCGYLVTGVFNDSIVSVAPVFWGLLGLGISCNYLASKENA